MGKGFTETKQELVNKIDELYKEYYEFTAKVSPYHWRRTGKHLSDLREMKEEIKELTIISRGQLKKAKELGLIDK